MSTVQITPNPLTYRYQGRGVMEKARGGISRQAEARAAHAERVGRESKARQTMRYRLQRRADGLFVNIDLSGFAAGEGNGWIGFRHQLDCVLARRPDLGHCRIVEVPPARTGEAGVIR